MRLFLATTCVSALAIGAAAVPASAQTVISTAVTTNVKTSDGNADIRITSTGSVKPPSGAAVTIDTNNKVTNEGAIQITGANGSTGILANPGLTGDIVNSGTITIDETFTPTDTDNDGDIDGPFAQGTDRFGIRVLGGGTYTGTINNSGTITVEGNNSGGIAVDSALTGSILNSGGITVTGDNSVGLRAGNVSGNVILSKGTISAKGANSVGVQMNGNIGGAFVIQGTVQSTGYRSTSAPADVSKLDADDLLQGGSAVVIRGNVAGGVLFDAPPKDLSTTDTDEDDDGVPDANETTANVATFGSAPAVQIGSNSQSVTLGAVGSTGRGLVNRGTIAASGVYKGVSATGLSLGGLGQAVTVTGGILNNGSIAALAVEADASAIRIGAQASVPLLENVGVLGATGGGTATTGARTVLVEAGGNLQTIRNSGTITAGRAGTDGVGAAIVDRSGTLSLIENSGFITVTGVSALTDKAIAFDLGANSGGATVRQLTVASSSPAPAITGSALFGSGNDLFDIQDGTVTGNVSFGGGNDSLTLSGDAVMTGNVGFGAGSGSLSLAGSSRLDGDIDFAGGGGTIGLTGTSAFTGQILNSAGVGVSVGTGTTLTATNLGTVNLGSLTVGDNATLGVTIGSTGNTLYNVSGTAAFGVGDTIAVNLVNTSGVTGTYTIVDAGTLTTGGPLTAAVGDIPFLFDASVNASTTTGEVQLTVRQKTADELGLNRSEGTILPAVLEAADADASIAGVLLSVTDSAALQDTLQQLLPEHSGGAFESATKGVRMASRMLLDPTSLKRENGSSRVWIGQVGWGSSKAIGDTSAYKLGGWGVLGGGEFALGDTGAVGVSLGYYSGRDRRRDNELTDNQYEGAVYVRAGDGPLKGFARAGASRLKFDGNRLFSAVLNNQTIERQAKGKWTGTGMSAAAGVSYDISMGKLSIRPAAEVEYLRLKEKGYSETGGGDAFNLTVDGRKSSETAAIGTVALGYQLMKSETTADHLRLELEGGYRSILSGKLGKTTARFGDTGTPFTLTPEERDSSWVAALRAVGGGSAVTFGAEINAEQQMGRAAVGGRATVKLAL